MGVDAGPSAGQLHMLGIRNPRGFYQRVMNLRHRLQQEHAALTDRVSALKMDDKIGACGAEARATPTRRVPVSGSSALTCPPTASTRSGG